MLNRIKKIYSEIKEEKYSLLNIQLSMVLNKENKKEKDFEKVVKIQKNLFFLIFVE